MALDPLSPIAPARPRSLLLPVGRITRAKFRDFVRRLRSENVVRLGDVSPDGRPNRTMFSPLAAPTGMIIHNFSTALPPDSYLTLSPFELFRVPLIIIGIADGSELANRVTSGGDEEQTFARDARHSGLGTPSLRAEELSTTLQGLREQYPRALIHRLLLFDSSLESADFPDDILVVPPPALCKTTTMKTVICDITSVFLAELTTFAKSIQGLPTIESPTMPSYNRRANGHLSWDADRDGNTRYSQARHDSGRQSITSVKNHHRMSLPATTTLEGIQTTSPPGRTRTPPPTTFEEISALHGSSTSSPPQALNRVSVGESVRELIREKVAVHGFGSGSLSERARNQGKGRIALVIGGLYLLAGRWEDAVRESVESASIAKAGGDHLWHAKALENILVSLIMLAWAGLDFQIPSVCYQTAEKGAAQPPRPGQHVDSDGGQDPASSSFQTTPHRLVSLQNLVNLLPDLLSLILSLYSRASAAPLESIPQVAYSEFIVRYAKILTAAHNCAGRLDNDALQYLALSAPLPTKMSSRMPHVGVAPSRTWISSVLFKAMPSSASDGGMAIVDRAVIYSGIASVMSSLGFQRKKSFVLRELVAALIPGLVQARKLGAAAVGVHPAAGLTPSARTEIGSANSASVIDDGGELGGGVEEILSSFSQIYGTDVFRGLQTRKRDSSLPQSKPGDGVEDASFQELFDSNEAAIARSIQHATLRSFGNHRLKLFALRYCINFCESLPDFQGMLRFTSELLRTAGSGIAPEAGSRAGSATLAREEQTRLAAHIHKALSATERTGRKHIVTDYWDEFLVRSVELLAPPSDMMVYSRKREDIAVPLTTDAKIDKTPFIYNPYLKKSDVAKDTKVLVAGEDAQFRITLQNLFDFEIEIERLKLDTKGVEFESVEHGTIVGPYRKQTMIVIGVPKRVGTLEVNGCIVKVTGCRERRFPIFRDAWYGEREFKIQAFGLDASLAPLGQLADKLASEPKNVMIGPKPSYLSFDVVGALPHLILKKTSFSQTAVMLLEGESRVLTFDLYNMSPTSSVDALFFSYEDSTSGPLKLAMQKKGTTATGIHELELLSRKHAFRWKGLRNASFNLGPGESSSIEVEVLGKPGLTRAVLQLDYTSTHSATESVLLTRHIKVPVAITVNACVEFVRADVIPFSSEFSQFKMHCQEGSCDTHDDQGSKASSLTGTQHQAFREKLGLRSGSQCCLLLLDLRNAWPTPLTVEIQVAEAPTAEVSSFPPSSGGQDDLDSSKGGHYVTDLLQPGQTSRFMLLLPRVLVQNAHAPIPVLDPANRRQFIVDSNKTPPDVERMNRELFWYREEILRLVRGAWRDSETGRSGIIELRNLRLNSRMLDAVRQRVLGITLSLSNSAATAESHAFQVGPSKYEVKTGEFIILRTRVLNRAKQRMQLYLRLQPSLRHQATNVALDISKHFLWNGVLQQPLPALEAMETRELELPICLLHQGEYEITASVEDVGARQSTGKDNRQKKDTEQALEDSVMGIWYADEPCVIIARDEIQGGARHAITPFEE